MPPKVTSEETKKVVLVDEEVKQCLGLLRDPVVSTDSLIAFCVKTMAKKIASAAEHASAGVDDSKAICTFIAETSRRYEPDSLTFGNIYGSVCGGRKLSEDEVAVIQNTIRQELRLIPEDTRRKICIDWIKNFVLLSLD